MGSSLSIYCSLEIAQKASMGGVVVDQKPSSKINWHAYNYDRESFLLEDDFANVEIMINNRTVHGERMDGSVIDLGKVRPAT